MPLPPQIYCAEQILIPPTFPHILKLYAKAAIRTQPYDLLRWTCAYFRALAKGEPPPVKERLEYPPFAHPSGITPGYLKTLRNRFCHCTKVSSRSLLDDWHGIALPEPTLYRIFVVGGRTGDDDWDLYEFLAIACGFLGKNLFETMIYVCELLTDEPEGGSAMILLRVFLDLYVYLARLDATGECPCDRKAKLVESEDLFRPCGRTSASEVSSGTPESIPCPETPVREGEDTGQDICVVDSTESQPSRTHRLPEDYRDDARSSEVDVGHKMPTVLRDNVEIETERVDHLQHEKRDEDFNDIDAATLDDDSFFDFPVGERDGEEEMEKEVDDYVPIGLETILEGICECQEPVRERVLTPPPPDPLDEFFKRMEEDMREGCLEASFRVAGIGPPVSEDRITAVGLWLADCARRQDGFVGPRNIRHFLCPDLYDVAEEDD